MITSNKLHKILAAIVIFVFFAVIVSGLLVPIYGDEVSTKMTQATVFMNGEKMLTAIPQCLPDLTVQIPATWYPAAGIYQLLYNGLDPLTLRISGVVFALLFASLSALGLRNITPTNQPVAPLLAGFFAVLGLGVLPLTLILSRSEQWLLLLLTYFIFFPLVVKKEKRKTSAINALVFLIFTSLFFYTHSKSAFFFPVVIASAWVGFRGRRLFQTTTVTFAVICLFQTIFFGKELYRCEYAPILASSFASQTANLSSWNTQPLELIKLLMASLASSPEKIIQHILFRESYQSAWLPSIPSAVSNLQALINPAISLSTMLVIVFGLILPPATILVAHIRSTKNHRHLLIATIWLSIVAHLAIYTNWNFYSGVLVVAILALLNCFCLIDIPWTAKIRSFGASIFVALCGIFLLSSFVLATSIMPRLSKALDETDIFGVPEQSLSIPTFGYPQQRSKIRKFARECGITGDGSTHLVIDDLTYFAFENMREPLHLVYISEKGMGSDIKGPELIPLLNKMNSPGIIAQCTFLPDIVLPYALKEKNLCCVRLKAN